MKMFIKKSFAMILAITMLISALSASFSAFADEKQYPYVDESGTYWRISDGEPKAFNTNYDEMVAYFQQQLINRSEKISYSFATTDSSYAYSYTDSEEKAAADAVAVKLYKNLYNDIFTTNTDDPRLGDYLYNSVTISSYGADCLTSAPDNPSGDNPRYYTFIITMGDITYISTAEEEEKIADFAKEFSDIFLATCDTDYKKVKTIYDFVVRNSTYDYDVFNGKYDIGSERYNIAHSAYGAIFGALINDGKTADDYDMSVKDSIIAQKIIYTADQGLAVCEGYSKLFYYLCTYNSIQCRIVDGDYIAESAKDSDPHEWNYVYLDDGCGDGYKWFQVDTTFASQKSFKQIDINNYDYFLRGTGNINLGYMNHQQPYAIGNADIKQQLYDWYSDENKSSYEDYRYPLADFDSTLSSDNDTVIIKRSTVYNEDEGEKNAFIITDMRNSYMIEIDEDGNFNYNDVDGFSYNGTDSDFTVIIPYLIDSEYNVEDIKSAKECGRYSINVNGESGTLYETQFSIVPLNMSNDKEGNYIEHNVQISGGYTGSSMTADIVIIDRYNNELQEGIDFDFYVFSDINHTIPTEIRDQGTYYLDVAYKGNYSGHYYLTFEIGKINLSQINSEENEFEYYPKYLRSYYGVTDATSYFNKVGANLRIGDITIQAGVDYSITANGGLEYGDTGTMTLTGLSGSDKVEAGTTQTFNYVISKRFDISQSFNGQIADTNTTNIYYYTGSAIKPVSFDYLDQYLVKGTDYEIVSYSNNINAGEAEVTIKGINGCTGTATMKFLINPASIGSAQLSTSTSGGNLTYSLAYNGKTLVKGVDYTETKTVTSTGYTITIKGTGNFTGSRAINVQLSQPKTVTLSKTTYTYSGSANKPTVTVKDSAGKTIAASNYTVSYSNNTNVGTATVKVTFKGNYSGSISKTFKIIPKNTSISSVTAQYKGFTVKLNKYTTQTTGYQIQYSTSSSFSSSKTVTISNTTTSKTVTGLTAKKKYYVRVRTYKTVGSTKYYSSWSGAKTVTTSSYPTTITLSASSYTYDGKVKKPTVTVKNNGTKISSKYYTVSYSSGRKNVGKYTVTIKFKSPYSGTVKKTFTIKPKATTLSSVTAKSKGFTVKWKKLTTQTTGYQIQYSTSSSFSNAKTVTVTKNSTTSKTVTGLTGNKKYYVRIRTYKTVSGTKYYSSWSKAKTVTTKK